MSEGSRVRFDPQISAGNLLSIATMLAIGLGAFFTVQEGGKALAQRVDKIEKQIEKGDDRDAATTRALNDLKGAVIGLGAEQKAIRSESERQGRQLDRIEQLLQPRLPMPAPPAAPRDPITVYPPR
ncbi:MAG: hypothetical protein AB7G35_21950 [Hyphomicrobiaceae bacterium]